MARRDNGTGTIYQSPSGSWGRVHRDYLREHKAIWYNSLVLSGELRTYFADLNVEHLDKIIDQMKAAEGITEALKAGAPMAWVQRMNSIPKRAGEGVLRELIYGENRT